MINIINFIKSFRNILLYLLLLGVLSLYIKNNRLLIIFITTIILVLSNKELFNKKDIKKYLILIIKYWIIGASLMFISTYIINNLTGTMAINEIMNRKQLHNSLISSLIIITLLNPICEEIIFRGSFKKSINNKYLYCIFTSLLFGLFHVIFNGDIIYIVPYALMGYCLAKVYYETDNIYTSILMHTWHNLIMIILILTGVLV